VLLATDGDAAITFAMSTTAPNCRKVMDDQLQLLMKAAG
jgi:hypothetical protein